MVKNPKPTTDSQKTVQITLSVTQWAQVDTMCSVNKMTVNEALSHLISEGKDLVEVANRRFKL